MDKQAYKRLLADNADMLTKWASECSETADRINAYECKSGRHVTLVRLRDTGTTPFGVGCHKCDLDATSKMYRVPEPVRRRVLNSGPDRWFIRPTPDEWERYKAWKRGEVPLVAIPADRWDDVMAQTAEHIGRGGLILVPTEVMDK